MIRPSTAFWIVTVVAVGYGMFQVKYEVMQLEEQLVKVNRQIAESREAIHVLNAEWSFLTQPTRLAELAKRHLNLAPIGTARLGRIDTLPFRPADPPSAELPQAAAPAPAAPPTAAAPPADLPTRPTPASKPPAGATGTRIATAKLSIER
jgi:cell division protein FtsL